MRTDHPTWTERLARPLTTLLQNPWAANVARLSAVEDVLRGVHPLFSLTEVRARVLKVIDETADVRSFVLQPNALWRGARAGQFVMVRTEIDGRRVSRAYSLSSAPGERRLTITVKRQPGGRMSNHLHDELRPGSVLTLSQAMGEFVLPDPFHVGWPDRLLLLSAGSGITPVMAMLRELLASGHRGDIQFVHLCHQPTALIFARELHALAARHPNLSLRLHHSDALGRADIAALQHLAPDLGQRPTWLCGPASLMAMVQAHWRTLPAPAPLHLERFAAAPLHPPVPLGQPVAVSCERSAQTFTSAGAEPLLVQAERAGLAPAHGCRIGICRSCQCLKRSGTVQDLQTGAISSAPDELIRLCISAARSDLALDL